MHVHVDQPGTRWVALMTLGATSKFVVDNALKCERCFTRSSLPKHKSLRIVPNLSRGGTGGGKGQAKKWHSFACPSCNEIDLRSGDVLLFFGDPATGVAHGSLDTVRMMIEEEEEEEEEEAEEERDGGSRAGGPGGLPAWCDNVRVSCQYRLTTTYGVTRSSWTIPKNKEAK